MRVEIIGVGRTTNRSQVKVKITNISDSERAIETQHAFVERGDGRRMEYRGANVVSPVLPSSNSTTRIFGLLDDHRFLPEAERIRVTIDLNVAGKEPFSWLLERMPGGIFPRPQWLRPHYRIIHVVTGWYDCSETKPLPNWETSTTPRWGD